MTTNDVSKRPAALTVMTGILVSSWFMAPALTAQALTTYCTPGTTQACVAAAVSTAPSAGGGTEVTVRVANLEGTTIAGVTHIAAVQIHGIDLIGPESFAGGIPGPLAITLQDPAVAVADVEDRWGVYEIAEPGEYRGYALFTDIEQAGADLVGCNLPDNIGYPYYRTCGADGPSGELVFVFTTDGTWSAGQLGLTFGMRIPTGDVACEVPGTLWDSPDVPNCVTPGQLPPSQVTQSVVFNSTPPNPALLDNSYDATATASSGLAVIFSSSTPSVCSAVVNTVLFNAIGTCVIAADQPGNSGYFAAPQQTQSINVVWPFSGFASPIAPSPALNTAKAGSAIPISFTLGDDRGNGVMAAGSPYSTPISCSVAVAAGNDVTTIGAGSSSLTYDPLILSYTYVWKTEKSWSNTCRQLTVRLADGTSHIALFGFR